MRTIFDFHGGIHPPENKRQSTRNGIETIALPKELIIPVNQHAGAAADPVVNVDQHVFKGQLIAEAHGFVSANIHAPTSGTIKSIDLHTANHPSGMAVLSIVLESDGEDRWIQLEHCENPFELTPKEIIAGVRAAGLAGMGGAGFPTSVKLGGQNIHTLILNAAECEPYITADDMLLRHYANEVLLGARLLARVFPKLENILIGIEDNKPEAIASLQKALAESAENSAIEIVVVPTKYPSGGEKQLIKLLTDREVPSGKIPANIGIVMQNVATARAAWRAVRYGEPLISRITTVVGKALKNEGNIEVLIGTPIAHILEQRGYQQALNERVVVGGPMMGWAIEDTLAPVVKATNCLLLPSREELPPNPPEQACIRCGLCAEACPAELLPQQLYWYARAEDQDKLQAYNLFDCIECGACSYVCPSAIPLVQYYRAAKGTIRQSEKDKQKSDQARLRFEARQERIAAIEAEKEAKRLARKKAAEEAKALLTQKNVAQKQTPENESESSNTQNTLNETAKTETTITESNDETSSSSAYALKSDLVKEALAAAAQKSESSDAEKEMKRLQRGLSSSESRLERARETLLKNQQEGADTARLDALAARVKEAEQKVADARKKLEEAQQ